MTRRHIERYFLLFISISVAVLATPLLGQVTFERTYGRNAGDHGYCVNQTPDKGYIVVGNIWFYPEGSIDVYLLKTDSLGDTLWTRSYGGDNTDGGRWVERTSDGGYIIVGGTWSFGAGAVDVYLVRTDSLGGALWERTYGGPQSDYGYCVRQVPDEGYVITGSTISSGSEDVYLLRTDSLGDLLWERTYGDSPADVGWSVILCADGGYAIVGETWRPGTDTTDIYMVKTDSVGMALWTMTFGGSGHDYGYSVHQTVDGGYAVAGETGSFGAGVADVYLIKTDENGLTGVSEERTAPRVHVSGIGLLQNTPNPFHHSTLISYSLPATSEITLSIYDITGRLVETLVNETLQPGIHQVRWDRKTNPSGVYFYRLDAGGSVETRKMVVVE